MGRLAGTWIPAFIIAFLNGCSPQADSAATARPPGQAATMASREMIAFRINMAIDGRPVLTLLLSSDGAVTRGGSGKSFPVEPDVFMAQTDGYLFREARGLFNPLWSERENVVSPPRPSGPRHVLDLTFFFEDPPPKLLRFDYVSGGGPPADVRAFVEHALRVTQPWYDAQRKMVAEWDARGRPPLH